MTKLELLSSSSSISIPSDSYFPSESFLEGKRHITEHERLVLISNNNRSSDPEWNNLFVSDEFDPSLISNCEFSGKVVLGKLRKATLQFHDLVLETGLYHAKIHSCVFGDDVAIRNVRYLYNYRIGDRVMLFNVQEMSCTNHSKFGEGILKEGEPEENRIWIGVGNENDGRAVLPFRSMIPADAFIWSRNRDDKELMNRFVELTESTNPGTLTTYGMVENDVVIKNTGLIKDAWICSCAYIKGAAKLKNMTVCSSEEEPSQIGEGVEMVNGIMGYGSKVFYQAVAVRFIIGRNCQLKYGVRVLNTVLGDNSTVSCCELLNNLIFPFHEQHHNSSFLIAATVCGQSNIASGATIGSNHNSRSPDGEIYAGRGFWPGLCSDFKHNSRFASFVLVSKGSYQSELDVIYPFSLVSISSEDSAIHIIPAYWFIYNMFAMARNNSKFLKRDKRVVKVQHIETDPLAPDTMQEIFRAIDRIITLTAHWLAANDPEYSDRTDDIYQAAKDYLHKNPDSDMVLTDLRGMKRHGAKICKAARGYKEYRKVMKYFAVKSLMNWCQSHGTGHISMETFNTICRDIPLFKEWKNVGGQIIPEDKLNELFDSIKNRSVNSWDQVHSFYDQCQAEYSDWKARYSIWLLEELYSRSITEFNGDIFKDILGDVIIVSDYMYESSISSRQKDYSDYFRTITYRNQEEMLEVTGRIENNSFLKDLREETKVFNESLEKLFSEIC